MMPHKRVCIDLHDICIRVQGMRVTSQSRGYTRVNRTNVHLTKILIVSCTQPNSNIPIGLGSFPGLLPCCSIFPAACLALVDGRAFLESHPLRKKRSDGTASFFFFVIWTQAQLSLGFGGLGLRPLSYPSCAAFIASLSTSGCSNADNVHLQQAIIQFNNQVST